MENRIIPTIVAIVGVVAFALLVYILFRRSRLADEQATRIRRRSPL